MTNNIILTGFYLKGHSMTPIEKSILERLEIKIDKVHAMLLDPDCGIYYRVNENTKFRKTIQRIQWLIVSIVLGILVKMFIG